jgi:2-methylcitrate dehydratase PrpD
MEFSIAVAAEVGQAGLAQYDDKWVKDPRIAALLERIVVQSRADLEPDASADAVPAEVHVHARGKVFSRKVLVPSGDPRNPMTTEQRREKFIGCLAGLHTPAQSAAMFEDFERLDQFESLEDLMRPSRISRRNVAAELVSVS